MSAGKHILIVDDEPISLKVIQACFDDLPHKVDTCDSGQMAWELLQRDHSFDLIVLDRIMPEMDGMALFEKIQSIEHLRDIPIIMLTALDGEDEIIDAITAGVFDYLTKPVDKEKLLQLVESALSTR